MNYPPQNQPPDPQSGPPNSGSQAPGGQPPPLGQWPQGQPGSYSSSSEYPHQGWQGPPPPKKQTGIVIGVAVGAVLIATLAITGFAAPGFFLSKNDKAAAGNSQSTPTGSVTSKVPSTKPSSSRQPGTGTPQTGVPNSGTGSPTAGGTPANIDAPPAALAIAQKLVQALNAHDAAGANALICSDSRPDDHAKETISSALSGSGWKLAAAESVADGLGEKFTLQGTLGGQTATARIYLASPDFCMLAGDPAEPGQ